MKYYQGLLILLTGLFHRLKFSFKLYKQVYYFYLDFIKVCIYE